MSSTCGYDDLLKAAKRDGCETLLASFRPAYLKQVFERALALKENANTTPEGCAKKLLQSFKDAAAALEKANRLCDTMDRKHYEELVAADTTYVTSGVDKEKGRKVIFFRTGRIYNGIWRYQKNTPRADAFAAAMNLWMNAVIANIPLDAEGEKLQVIMICDCSEAGYLDFSPAMQLKSIELAVAMYFPLPPLVFMVGAPTVCRLLVKCFVACLPASMQYCIEAVESKDEMDKYVGSNDTPRWWYGDDSRELGVPYCPYNQRARWQFHKTLQSGYAVTLSEIWNPGPWLEGGVRCESVLDESQVESRDATHHSLETIEEDSEDGW